MSERSEQLRAALAARLERVRGTLSDEELSHLLDDVVHTTQRFEEIDAREKGVKPVSGLSTFKEPETRPR